jgi:ubiquinone/menaquinone biosynthesis C-methylase UbiE
MKQLPDTQSPVSYYDLIADDYDSILEQTDKRVRSKVAEKFKRVTPSGTVLDFGGGTGLDLQWLAEKYTRVYFCEPSAGMKNKAIERTDKSVHKGKIVFVDDAFSDFKKWETNGPFDEKVDAILANFAVVNCIDDITGLFKSLSLVIKPGGNLMILVLENRFLKLLKHNPVRLFKYKVFDKPLSASALYKEYTHVAHIYSNRAIRRASDVYFNWIDQGYMEKDNFSLIHLKRK